MGSLRPLLVFALLAVHATSAAAAAPGKEPKPRLGTFSGQRTENATVAGQAEPQVTSWIDAKFKVRKGRLYITAQPLGTTEKHPWRQSFKVTEDYVSNGVRVIGYERDAHPVAVRNNEKALAKAYGGSISLRGMSGNGRVFIWNKTATWNNIGDGELRMRNPTGGEYSARYDWSETFQARPPGDRKLQGPPVP